MSIKGRLSTVFPRVHTERVGSFGQGKTIIKAQAISGALEYRSSKGSAQRGSENEESVSVVMAGENHINVDAQVKY